VELDKIRLAVVTRVADDYIEVIGGRGKPFPGIILHHVPLGSRAASCFAGHLAKDTYFRHDCVHHVTPTQFRNRVGMVPPREYPNFEGPALYARRMHLVIVHQSLRAAASNAPPSA
jgi:hypothetical protein